MENTTNQVPSKVPSMKGWAKDQREAGPEGQDLQVPLKTDKIKSGHRRDGRDRHTLPRPIGLNPVAGCVPPFFPSVLNSKWKALAEGFGYKTKTINTGYLCPVAEARAPLDRQMGVGLGVLCSRPLKTKTIYTRNVLVRAGRHGTIIQTPTSACLCERF